MGNLEPYRQKWIAELETEKARLERQLKTCRRDHRKSVDTSAAITDITNKLVFLDCVGRAVDGNKLRVA